MGMCELHERIMLRDEWRSKTQNKAVCNEQHKVGPSLMMGWWSSDRLLPDELLPSQAHWHTTAHYI